MYDDNFDQQEHDDEAAFLTDMAEMEFATRCYDVQCEICAVQEKASEMVLRQKNWSLSKAGEFCPSH